MGDGAGTQAGYTEKLQHNFLTLPVLKGGGKARSRSRCRCVPCETTAEKAAKQRDAAYIREQSRADRNRETMTGYPGALVSLRQ